MKVASKASFTAALRPKCPSERRRYLKLREENRGEKHLAKTHELWISLLSYCTIWRVWVLSSQCCWLCRDLVIQVQACRSSRSERPSGKADGIALPSAGAADVPLAGTNKS